MYERTPPVPPHAATNVEVAQLLFYHDADVTAQDKLRRIPLHDVSIVQGVSRLLPDHGADATAQDGHKQTLSHRASSMKVAQRLLDYGADATAQDAYQRTPKSEIGYYQWGPELS